MPATPTTLENLAQGRQGFSHRGRACSSLDRVRPRDRWAPFQARRCSEDECSPDRNERSAIAAKPRFFESREPRAVTRKAPSPRAHRAARTDTLRDDAVFGTRSLAADVRALASRRPPPRGRPWSPASLRAGVDRVARSVLRLRSRPMIRRRSIDLRPIFARSSLDDRRGRAALERSISCAHPPWTSRIGPRVGPGWELRGARRVRSTSRPLLRP